MSDAERSERADYSHVNDAKQNSASGITDRLEGKEQQTVAIGVDSELHQCPGQTRQLGIEIRSACRMPVVKVLSFLIGTRHLGVQNNLLHSTSDDARARRICSLRPGYVRLVVNLTIRGLMHPILSGL